jgi:hypothetical protein
MSDYESEDEGQPIERQSRRGHADRVIAPASTRPQQRNLSNRSQVHHQMSPRTQPAQRKSSCDVHPDIQTDVGQHNVSYHRKIAPLQHISTSTPRRISGMPQAINSITGTRTADLLPTVLPMAKLSHHAIAVTKHRRALRRTMVVSESSKTLTFAGTDIPQTLNTCIQAPMGARHVLTQDQTLK